MTQTPYFGLYILTDLQHSYPDMGQQHSFLAHRAEDFIITLLLKEIQKYKELHINKVHNQICYLFRNTLKANFEPLFF